jgi:hypothetical protein
MNEQEHAVESITLKLDNIDKGIFHYYEAEFKENYASKISFVLFGMINNYKLYGYMAKNEVGVVMSEEEKKRDKKRE